MGRLIVVDLGGAGLAWLRRRRLGRAMTLSLGSCIGSLDEEDARSLLRGAAALGGDVVLGADLRLTGRWLDGRRWFSVQRFERSAA